ncbi:hypothetical protein BD311DRAFT_754733 [Dichomitus squalens]|uniref:Uncharacterized protein n=1 Tax=Dichomitus squalens TaxID=114155 RepID=A0A4Q9MVP0_9APHY|nr:hypothetical protein BD311DRAFT_754733 [Dichomitus squalens]
MTCKYPGKRASYIPDHPTTTTTHETIHNHDRMGGMIAWRHSDAEGGRVRRDAQVRDHHDIPVVTSLQKRSETSGWTLRRTCVSDIRDETVQHIPVSGREQEQTV